MHTFKHFKNGHQYVLLDEGISAETDEPMISYRQLGIISSPIFFSTVRRMVEDVDRPEFGVRQPRFQPLSRDSTEWRDEWRQKLQVTVEKR